MSHLYTQEGFDFQSESKLAQAIDGALKNLRLQKPAYGNAYSVKQYESLGLDSIIKRYTNVSVRMNLREGFTAYTFMPDLNKNHVFAREIYDWLPGGGSSEAYREIAKRDMFEGTVDLQNSKVTGAFTKVYAEINIGEKLVNNKSEFTTSEVTAIILHELGHVMMTMLYCARYTKTNYIMLEGVRRLNEANTKEERIRILDDIERIYDQPIKDKQKYAESKKHPLVYQTLILERAANESVNQLGANIYNNRSFEQLADQFAVRHGYGVHLGTGLAKLHSLYGYKENRNKVFHYIINICKMVLFLTALIFATYTLNYILLVGLIGFLMTNPLDALYDDQKDRLIRIVEELRYALKDKNLEAEEKKSILNDISVVEETLNALNDNMGVYEFIWAKVFPWGRADAANISHQKQLEQMLNNPLYEASAKLSLLT